MIDLNFEYLSILFCTKVGEVANLEKQLTIIWWKAGVSHIYLFLALQRGVREVSNDVISLVSHACEERLRHLTEKVSLVAEHRMDYYKVRVKGIIGQELFPLFLNITRSSEQGLVL